MKQQTLLSQPELSEEDNRLLQEIRQSQGQVDLTDGLPASLPVEEIESESLLEQIQR